jgi:hypothetical protein
MYQQKNNIFYCFRSKICITVNNQITAAIASNYL